MRTVIGKHFYGTTLYMPVDTVYKDCVFKNCELIVLHHDTRQLITVGPEGTFRGSTILHGCEVRALDGLYRDACIRVLLGEANLK